MHKGSSSPLTDAFFFQWRNLNRFWTKIVPGFQTLHLRSDKPDGFMPHYHRLCRWMWPLSSLAAWNIMFPVCPLKGPRWGQAIFSAHIAVLPCSDLTDSSVWRWKKGFMSPLDDLPITSGPTAVVKRCVSMCESVCVSLCKMCVQTSIATSSMSQDFSGWSLEDGLEGFCLSCVVFNKLLISLQRCAVVALTVTRKVHPSGSMNTKSIMKKDRLWSQHWVLKVASGAKQKPKLELILVKQIYLLQNIFICC